MDFTLKGKTAIVTGATKGMGRAIAGVFAEHGAKLTIVSRTEADCIRVAQEIREAGAEAIAVPGNIGDIKTLDHIIEKTAEAFGRIDILVNNAGVAVTEPALSVTEEAWDRVQAVDLKSTFFFSQKVVPWMMKQGGGRIINVASVAGLFAQRGLAPYCAAKGGVIALTRVLAMEWQKYNITVNAICPGYIRTPMNDEIIDNQKVVEKILSKIPARRFGHPEEISGMALYLASEASSYLTGQAICIDGGISVE